MCVFNPNANDYDSGFVITEYGTMRFNKIGAWVFTIDECMMYLKARGYDLR